MFYLKVFFKGISENLVVGCLFILMTGFMVFSLIGETQVKDILQKKLSHAEDLSFFYALISAKENHNRIARKLRELDEIKKIETVGKAALETEVKRILGELDTESMKAFWDMNYVALKVVFAKKVSLKAQELIREYIVRLVGLDNLMLGEVNKNDTLKNSNLFLIKMSKYSYPGVLAVGLVIWAVLYIIVRKSLLRTTYLIEQFQRRSNVLVKTLLSGLVFVFLAFTAAACLMLTPNFFNLIGVLFLLFASIAAGLKKYTWD